MCESKQIEINGLWLKSERFNWEQKIAETSIFYKILIFFLKISKVADCSLTQIGELDFDFQFGGCNTIQDKIMLCFSSQAPDKCHS